MAELQDVLDKLDLVNDVKLEIKDVISTDSLHFEDYPNLIAEHLTSDPSEQTIADRATANGATIKDGVAFLKALKGNSIKWNQLSNNLNIPVITSNGITFTKNADGSVSASGTATSSAYYIINLSATSGHKYALVGNPTGTSYGTYCLTAYGSSALVTTGKDAVFTPSANIVSLRIIVWNGNTINTTFRPMLFDLTAMGWEDITTADQFAQRLGFASANDIPSFPYDEGSIKHFSASEIVSKGRNIFNPSQLTSAGRFILNDSGVQVADYTSSYWLESFAVKPNTQYIKQDSIDENGVQRIYFFDSNDVFISRTGNIGARNAVFTTPSNCTQIRIQYATASVNADVICIEQGNVSHGFAPYMTPSSLPLPSVSLYSAGTARDELDLAQGKLTRRIGIYEFTGSETWVASGSQQYFARCLTQESPLNPNNTLSNCLMQTIPTEIVDDVYYGRKTTGVGVRGSIVYISADDYNNRSTRLNGQKLYYELATPTTTDVDKSKAFYKVENGGREQVDVTTSSPLVATIAYEH